MGMTTQQRRFVELLDGVREAEIRAMHADKTYGDLIQATYGPLHTKRVSASDCEAAQSKAIAACNSIARDAARRLKRRLDRRDMPEGYRWSVQPVIQRVGRPTQRLKVDHIKLVFGIGPRIEDEWCWCADPLQYSTVLQFSAEPTAAVPTFLNRITPIIMAAVAALPPIEEPTNER